MGKVGAELCGVAKLLMKPQVNLQLPALMGRGFLAPTTQ